MSQLYFTSNYVPNKVFTEIEELFEYMHPLQVWLFFDTNILIYYREFYLDPVGYSTDPSKKHIFEMVKKLVYKTDDYEIDLNASVAQEEACRSRMDFKWDKAKETQTRMSVLPMLTWTRKDFDKHLRKGKKIEPIKISNDLGESKIPCLIEKSRFHGFLTIAYLSAMKIYLLDKQLASGSITRREAHLDYLDFALNVINVSAAVLISYSLHHFGGVAMLRQMLFTKKAASAEEILHQLFNGAIDLCFPGAVNNEQNLAPFDGNLPFAKIPVLVTADRRLSIIHGGYSTHAQFARENPNDRPAEVAAIDFHQDLQWTEEDIEIFYQRLLDDALGRIERMKRVNRNSEQLLPLVKAYEELIKKSVA